MATPIDGTANSNRDLSADAKRACDEIERLYRQALDAVEAAASDLSSATQTLSAEPAIDDAEQPATAMKRAVPGMRQALEPSLFATGDPSAAVEHDARVSGAQVIEALLFVGGQPLSTKAIGGALRGEFPPEFVERAIDELNRRYLLQNRPYEIRLGEGGYRFVLRGEFEPLRNRVYGFGPKHVRLSQETLEVLSLVAYRQPISRRSIEETGKCSAGSHLRQLVQRELLLLDRGEGEDESDAVYRTSPRFLQLFGLGRLDELPQIEDLDFK